MRRVDPRGGAVITRRRSWTGAVVGWGLLVSAPIAVVWAQAPSPAAEFTKAQADRGLSSYERTCARCHGSDLGGNEPAEVPPLEGEAFLRQWSDGPVVALIDKISNTMPADMPRTVARPTAIDITTYLLMRNGYSAGRVELRADDPQLGSLRLERLVRVP